MRLLPPRRRADAAESSASALQTRPDAPTTETTERRVPDPGRVPTNRGRWEDAALVNVDITEVVKRQLGTVTQPWHK